MDNFEFKDRVPTYPGRKSLRIISQTADTMLVDEVMADEPTEQGTLINKDLMDNIQAWVVNAKNIASNANVKSDNAVNSAANANTVASQANNTSGEAKTLAQEAKTIANGAQSLANQTSANFDALAAQVVNQQGTKVTVGGSFVTQFDADTKLDKNTFDKAKFSTSVLVKYEVSNYGAKADSLEIIK